MPFPAFLVRALVDLVLPLSCPGCPTSGHPTSGHPTSGYPMCDACLCALAGPPFTAVPSPPPPGLPPCAAAATYGGPVRDLVLAYKERGQRDLARPLGAALTRAVAHAAGQPGVGPVVLVPVPATATARQARGHAHVMTLARRAAAGMRAGGRPAQVLPLLWVARPPVDQAALGTAARAANLDHAFHARRPARGARPCRVVLVDDVLTTGATLAEAARALADADAEVEGAAVVAAAALRHPARSSTRRSPSGGAGPAARFSPAGRAPHPPAAEIA